MTVLITGGAGFIGSRLLAALGSEEDVVVVDSLHTQVHGENAVMPANTSHRTYVRGDVTDPGMWDNLLSTISPTTVIHLAAETGTGQSLLEASRHTNVNVNGTAVMLDALARNARIPQAVLLTSSRAVYGEGKWHDPVEGKPYYGRPRTAIQLDRVEWTPTGPDNQSGIAMAHDSRTVVPNPANIYAATKLAQENILVAWCASMGVSLSVLRLQNVYGAGQALRNPYTGVLTTFARQVLSGQAIEVYEEGGIVRDFVHVSDVISAIQKAMGRPSPQGRHRVVDIGSGDSNTLLHFASVISEAAGAPGVVTTRNYRLGDVRSAFASNAHAAAELGYSPKVQFPAGARELLEWARGEISHES